VWVEVVWVVDETEPALEAEVAVGVVVVGAGDGEVAVEVGGVASVPELADVTTGWWVRG
jgi:hypothetical protein